MNRLLNARRMRAALTLGLVFGLSACSVLRDTATHPTVRAFLAREEPPPPVPSATTPTTATTTPAPLM